MNKSTVLMILHNKGPPVLSWRTLLERSFIRLWNWLWSILMFFIRSSRSFSCSSLLYPATKPIDRTNINANDGLPIVSYELLWVDPLKTLQGRLFCRDEYRKNSNEFAILWCVLYWPDSHSTKSSDETCINVYIPDDLDGRCSTGTILSMKYCSALGIIDL